MPRTHSLDNLRTFLTALVIIHHASIAYGGLGSWIYTPSANTYPPGSSLPILIFNVMNQTFFMAIFFLLSGYFSAIASQKRSKREFLKEKLRRLGVPTLVYSVLGRGVVMGIIARSRDGHAWGKAAALAWEETKSIRGVRGPVWYCALLLIFDILYSMARPADLASLNPTIKFLTRSKRQTEVGKDGRARKTIPALYIFISLTLSSSASFLIRLYYPSGTVFTPLQLNLGYVPQYVLFYVSGVYIYRSLRTDLHSAMRCNSGMQLMLWLIVFWITWYGIHVVDVKTAKEGLTIEDILRLGKGGWNVLALFYAVWNECVGVLMAVLLVRWFAASETLTKKWIIDGIDLARYSYAAFLMHAPVLVYLQCLLDGWEASGLAKSVVVGAIGVAGSWVGGWVLVDALELVGIRTVI